MSNVAAICSQFNTGYNIVWVVPSITLFVETAEHKERGTCGPDGFYLRRARREPPAARSKRQHFFGAFL
jgi:hypothetical protein